MSPDDYLLVDVTDAGNLTSCPRQSDQLMPKHLQKCIRYLVQLIVYLRLADRA